ncbi:hypothetical protein ACFSM5_07825 [Lacibacterium aquatile]|uniref:Tyr recombinase domain-containing protein n=1 Tax=Lacibacterium aquatile TaxID=1168082 RepID=A0ABW5DNU4_9PROT
MKEIPEYVLPEVRFDADVWGCSTLEAKPVQAWRRLLKWPSVAPFAYEARNQNDDLIILKLFTFELCHQFKLSTARDFLYWMRRLLALCAEERGREHVNLEDITLQNLLCLSQHLKGRPFRSFCGAVVRIGEVVRDYGLSGGPVITRWQIDEVIRACDKHTTRRAPTVKLCPEDARPLLDHAWEILLHDAPLLQEILPVKSFRANLPADLKSVAFSATSETRSIHDLSVAVQGAAILLISFLVGMRASEIAALEPGAVRMLGVNKNVPVLVGQTFKTTPNSPETFWPCGEVIARVVEIIETTFAEHRAQNGITSLFVATRSNATIAILTTYLDDYRNLFADRSQAPRISIRSGRKTLLTTIANLSGRTALANLTIAAKQAHHRDLETTMEYIDDSHM